MKETIEQLLEQAVHALQSDSTLPADVTAKIQVTRTKDASHGDFACNLAMMLAKPAAMKPRDLAERLVAALPESSQLEKVEIAGPGFINFTIGKDELHSVVSKIIAAGDTYGHSDAGNGVKVQVEYVSANPTGPLHVGHGRGAAIGATLANLLAASGFDVQREYYVNDAGRQMDILAASVWLRYLEAAGEQFPFPVNGYKGDYIRDIAAALQRDHGQQLHFPASEVFDDSVPADEPTGGDKEAHIDGIIARAKALLEERYAIVFDAALDTILDDIRDDMAEFGVVFDNYFSERSLQSEVSACVETLKSSGYLYEKGGAWWLKTTDFGDEKDRVVIRDNGQTTYFASDIAYLKNKFERGFDQVLYVFGADHHGYVSRMKAACTALGYDADKLEFLLIQFANLFSSGERQQMSTRSGQFVTIRQLRDEVGKDAARFFYVMRRYQQHLEFDLDLARSQTRDNPVYYVQYAHARICSVFRQARDQALDYDQPLGLASLSLLTETHETALMSLLAGWPDTVLKAATNREPHLIVVYLQELANGLNKYYEAHKWLLEEAPLRNARLSLILAAQHVLANGLQLLDVTAPEVL